MKLFLSTHPKPHLGNRTLFLVIPLFLILLSSVSCEIEEDIHNNKDGVSSIAVEEERNPVLKSPTSPTVPIAIIDNDLNDLRLTSMASLDAVKPSSSIEEKERSGILDVDNTQDAEKRGLYYQQCPHKCIRSILHARRCHHHFPTCGGYFAWCKSGSIVYRAKPKPKPKPKPPAPKPKPKPKPKPRYGHSTYSHGHGHGTYGRGGGYGGGYGGGGYGGGY